MHPRFLAPILAYLIAAAWLLKPSPPPAASPASPTSTPSTTSPPRAPSPSSSSPAKSPHIEASLYSLLHHDYPVQIIAVDDRSTDATGALTDALAQTNPDKLTVLHVTTLPGSWLGKTHALAAPGRAHIH